MSALIDETGNRYGRLTVLERAHNGKGGAARWLCQCECGGQTVTTGNALRRGYTKSCGCWQIERTIAVGEGSWRQAFREYRQSRTLPEGEAAFNKLYYKYGREAKKRGLQFGLSRDEFRELTGAKCHYCGIEPSQEAYSNTRDIGNGAYLFNGVDRRDNNVGYIYANCVPCCKVCNRAKSDMDYAEFVAYLDGLAAFRSKLNAG